MAYITLEDVRVEGVTVSEEYNDELIEGRILLAQEFIERITRRYFETRVRTLTLSGTGHNILSLPIPPISDSAITEVAISGEVLDTDYYSYTMSRDPGIDDRLNPRIFKSSGVWTTGTNNITVTGSFGFVESDETPPPLIKDLCVRITIWDLSPIGTSSGGNASNIIEEQLGDYRYKLSDSAALQKGFFGDSRIDNIISMYRAARVGSI